MASSFNKKTVFLPKIAIKSSFSHTPAIGFERKLGHCDPLSWCFEIKTAMKNEIKKMNGVINF